MIDHLLLSPKYWCFLCQLTKQILSMVDAVKCPICLYMLHQPIELPCHAYAICSLCLKEWIRVTVHSSAPAAIQSPVFSPPSSYSLQSLSLHNGALYILWDRCYGLSLQHTPLPSAQQAMIAAQVLHELLQNSTIQPPTRGAISTYKFLYQTSTCLEAVSH